MDIMEEHLRSRWSVDVRQMLCAQALALVARAMAPLEPGRALEVIYDTEDVRQDLLAWAQDRGYAIEQRGADRMALTHR